MNGEPTQKAYWPLLFGLVTFFLLLIAFQFIAYQRYHILKKADQDILQHRLDYTKTRFLEILAHKSSSANTLAILYKHNNNLPNFDSIAKQIIKYDPTIDAINLTDHYTITYSYYPTGNKNIVGSNLLDYPLFKKEIELAVKNNVVLFAGPYHFIAGGGLGITCRVPIYKNDSFVGLSTVATRLSTLYKLIPEFKNKDRRFVFRLSKVNPVSNKVEYFFPDYTPRKNTEITVKIPEGNWTLHAAYSREYPLPIGPYIISILGLLLSISMGVFVYLQAKLPERLDSIIKQKTNDLASSEKYYRSIIESSTDVITLFDASGKALYTTPSFEKLTGYSPDEINGLSSIDIYIDPAERHDAEDTFRYVADTANVILHKRHKLRHKNGSTVYIDGIYRNLLHDENVKAIIYTYTDITEQVLTNLKLDKTVHEVALLNKVNDYILRATDENTLLTDICKCIIESGGYKLAWIGFMPPDKDITRTVIPSYAFGNTQYLREINITLTDEKLSNGPTAKALLTGQIVITNNVSSAEHFKPWLEKAQKYDISASIVLPLIFNTEFAALNIYSGQIDAFDEHEIKILERIASNTSQAINALRTKIEKEKAQYDLGKRIKELSTIYHLNEIIKNDKQNESEVIRKIVDILPIGWQYVNDCASKIHFDGKDYTTNNYAPSPISQVAEFVLFDGRKGFIEVVYSKEKPKEYEGCFLKEERDLINTAADTITVYFNKAAQQKVLTESEAKFRGAFESSAIGMALVSLNGEWVRVNKTLCDMLGYTREELTKLTFQQITHPDDLYSDLKFLEETIQGKRTVYRMEKRYFHKNGSVIWINLNVALVKDNNQQPLYFVSQIENITEKKQITEQLRENEHKLRLFVEHSPASLAMFDMDMKYILTSKRWITDYKLNDKEVIGKSHYEVFPTIPQHWKEIHQRCLAGASEKCDEDSFIGEDGTLNWLYWEIHPWYKASGEIGGIIMFTEVITDRVETRMKYQTLVEQSLVGVYIIQDGKFVYVNPILAKESGYSSTELIGMGFQEFIHPDDLQVVATNLQARSEWKTENNRYEVRAITREKNILWIELFGAAIMLNGKKAIMGTIVNINDRKNLEIERQRIIHDLVQRNRDLEQFAHILSHNVRAPLSTILGLSELYKEEQDEKDRAITIKGIEQSAEQLDGIIKDLNDILRVKHSLAEIKNICSFDDITRNVKAILADKLNESGARIETDYSAMPQINTVQAYMTSIFYNIISNAIKYAQSGIEPVIKIRSSLSEGKMKLVFNDNGIGIDMSKHGNQLFGLYKRFHSHVEGKGLGLYIVKTQVEALNGTIQVNSSLNKGTEFIIWFEGQ